MTWPQYSSLQKSSRTDDRGQDSRRVRPKAPQRPGGGLPGPSVSGPITPQQIPTPPLLQGQESHQGGLD